MIRTIQTAVDTVIRQVERSEENDSISVESKFDFFGDIVNALDDFGVFTGEKHRRFTVSQSRTCTAVLVELRPSLFEKRVNESGIVFVCFGVNESVKNFIMVNEVVSMWR